MVGVAAKKSVYQKEREKVKRRRAKAAAAEEAKRQKEEFENSMRKQLEGNVEYEGDREMQVYIDT